MSKKEGISGDDASLPENCHAAEEHAGGAMDVIVTNPPYQNVKHTHLFIEQSPGLFALRLPKERLKEMARDAVLQTRQRPIPSGLMVGDIPVSRIYTKYGKTAIVVLVGEPQPGNQISIMFLLATEFEAHIKKIGSVE